MNCKETTRLICDYLEGKLSPSMELSLRRHLGQCKNCRLVLDGAQQTIEIYFSEEPRFRSLNKSQVA